MWEYRQTPKSVRGELREKFQDTINYGLKNKQTKLETFQDKEKVFEDREIL